MEWSGSVEWLMTWGGDCRGFLGPLGGAPIIGVEKVKGVEEEDVVTGQPRWQ